MEASSIINKVLLARLSAIKKNSSTFKADFSVDALIMVKAYGRITCNYLRRGPVVPAIPIYSHMLNSLTPLIRCFTLPA